MRPPAWCLMVALLAAPLAAQEPPEEEPHFAGAPLDRLELQALLADAQAAEEAEEPEVFPVAPSVWCLVVDGEEEPASEGEEEAKGCDVGVAAVLYRFKRVPRLSVVGALGTWSLGPGLGWTFHRSESGTAYGVAGGLIAPWGSRGINVRDWGVGVGATLSFARPAQ